MYTFVLKNDRAGSYGRVAVLIFILHVLFFGYFLLKSGTQMVLVTGLTVALANLVLHFLPVKKKKFKVVTSICFLLMAAVWFMLSNFWPGCAMILLAFLDFIARRNMVVMVMKEGIEYPSFPKKTILWDQLNHIILKDGIITIDFKSGHLLQSEIAAAGDGIDEKEFTDFCSDQMQNKG